MKRSIRCSCAVAMLALMFTAAHGAQAPDAPEAPAAPKYRVTGPYAHEGLAVFLIHADRQDPREFLTLDEALQRKLVIITEKDDAEVQQLQIENKSDKPLYLQEGDRLSGGQQDRTIYASVVIPPKSGKMPVPAFCIEPSRWSQGAGGAYFQSTDNLALAPLQVRRASKIAKDQGVVWESVRQYKGQVAEALQVKQLSSSLNEAQDSTEATAVTNKFTEQLGAVPDKQADAIGVAFAVDGRIEEVNVYPSHLLLAKIYPRLLESYALDASTRSATGEAPREADDAAPPARPPLKHPTPDDVLAFMASPPSAPSRAEKINDDNGLSVYDLESKQHFSRSVYRGAPVHEQWMRADPNPPRPHSEAPQLQLPNDQDIQQLHEQIQELRQEQQGGAPAPDDEN